MNRNKNHQAGKILPILAAAVICVAALIFWKQHEEDKKQRLTEEQVKTVQQLAERWDDALKVAGSTSRIALDGPVQELQKIRREVSGTDVPECFTKAKERLVSGMDNYIEGFLAFMQQKEETSNEKIARAAISIGAFKERLNDCKPPK
jgi:hypothetical protein